MDSVLHTQTSSQSSSPRLRPVSDSKLDDNASVDSGVDSGFASASASTASLPQVAFTKAHLKHLNKQLESMHPIDILRFVKLLFPNLYQSTAFGLTGLVTLDMLSKLNDENPSSSPVDLIFLDTLHHFQETYDLVDRVRARYPNIKVHSFKPDGVETAAEFDNLYGERLYETSSELYDWIAKVEPQQRAYTDLGVAAILTGRRRSQGGQRGEMPVIEIDEERGGIVKINPMVNWSFSDVQSYIREHNVPYNALLDRGYKSIGDWHSTSPVAEGEDERAGRWKGQSKTECGIHNSKSRYAQYLAETAAREKGEQLAAALTQVEQERRVEVEVSS